MRWTDCTPDNADFTNGYDAGVREIRKTLGSYDHIAHLVFSKTHQSISGVSVRRWLKHRNLPITMACTIVDLVKEANPDSEISLAMFFPYLLEYIDDYQFV